MINLVGVFARKQFAEIIRQETSPSVLCLGYQLLSHRFYYFKVRCDGIKSVDWGSGQATDMRGRDMDDWSVALWFDTNYVIMNQASHKLGIYIIGPSRKKQRTEILGNLFIDFLRNADVAVAQTAGSTLQSLVGKSGAASCSLNPIGKISLGENDYIAHSIKGYIDKGSRVKVVKKRGLSLYVEKVEAEYDISGDVSNGSFLN